MFEAHVLHLLRRYLGEYVHGLSAEALRISVWKGDVVLKDLKLKAEALNSLKLPVTVKAGFIGTITLRVPWKSLGKEPVIVLIDRVFILAHPASSQHNLKEEDKDKLFEAKLQQIEESESATIEATSKSKLGNVCLEGTSSLFDSVFADLLQPHDLFSLVINLSDKTPPGNSWLGSLIATIIGNLKISISNVHIRYEDSVSNPGNPFSMGVTLAKLAAVTMDEQENETFDTSGALDKLRKSLQLERLAMYHDCNTLPWKIDKRWEDLAPKEWIEIFEDGINEPVAGHDTVSQWAMGRSFLVSPINGVLKYHRLGKQERNDPEVPFEKASLALNDVTLTVTEGQYHDWIKLMEVVSRYKIHVEVSHLRPMVTISDGPHFWWRYAAQASLQQKKMCYRFSWDRIRHLCQLRRRYVQLYAALLQQSSEVNRAEMREIEKDLDSKVILLWRLLAHARVESVRSKEAAEQRRLQKRSWFSFRWRSSSEDDLEKDAPEGLQVAEGRLTKEEWQAINNLLSYQQDEELTLHSTKDMQDMVRFLASVSVGQAAAKVINRNETEIICGRFEQLHVLTKLRHRSTHCDVLLKFYGLYAPEGSLAQSVISEQKVNALAATFVSSPVGEDVDWRLSATISPCHVTVLLESYNQFLEFVKRSNAVSPTVALETAAALQMRIEKVTRRAQEQFQMVLEEQSRFALDIDLDAPKVRVPIRRSGSSKCDSHLLLDFGNFTLRTTDNQLEEQRKNLYSRFYISGRDIAAFFTDCYFDSQNCPLVVPTSSNQPVASPIQDDRDSFCSLIDRCGMAVIVDQIKVPHPSYPSTRVSVQVPNLGIHFSPARYRRLMELLNILYGPKGIMGQPRIDSFEAELAPWTPTDLASDARILVWRGIGNSMATWQPCFLVLSGFYLYLLESEKSQSYQQCLSMAGRQIYEVPPTNIGGSPFCIAVSFRGMDTQKALESSSTWILELQGEEHKAAWLKGLIQATYQASAPPLVDVLGGTSEKRAELDIACLSNSKTADIVINGSLLETNLFIYGKTGGAGDINLEETPIIEVLAGGGKVHVIICEGDLTVKSKLHSLKIKDELQSRNSTSPQYLAFSVVENDNTSVSAGVSDYHGNNISSVQSEEDDIFKDALPDFISLSESSIHPHSLAMNQPARSGDIIDSTGLGSTDALMNENDLRKGMGLSDDIFYEAQGMESSDFVSVTFSTRSSASPDYDGIDTQMAVSMSKLEFFCNRPTLVALIGFGLDLSSVSTGRSDVNMIETSKDEPLVNEDKFEDNWRVKGLLGFGKGRVVFNLYMKVDSVCLLLNNEDGTQLAMLVQESFLLDIKVYPSSLSIEGMLGNFRLCDMSLGADHIWKWLCDIRNPGTESLIKLRFDSYSAEDDDYEGYDYSLQGRLSAVRIVFLYRFVQEVTAYFMELANPHTEEAIKLVDKVGGFEWLIQKYEIDGSSALKLDLSLDTPIIVVPKNSLSKDFIQLDLGQLQVTNDISWHGCPEKDPSAVHVDLLQAKILRVNMAVGINGSVGKPMIREGHGIDVYVRRSLRDVFRKIPTFSLEVKVGLLHAVMSDKEYNVILDSVFMNLCEAPRIPPSFRVGSSGSRDTMRLLADKVNTNSQILLSPTVTVIAVEVDCALLELCNGIDEVSPLANISLEGLWVSYRMTSLLETDLYVTIPKFSILDSRPETKSEMRLMLGSSNESSRLTSAGDISYSANKVILGKTSAEAGLELAIPSPTMFLMDYRSRTSSQSLVVRIQQPRVLFVPDFLLAVGEFFVPALGAITGREETMDPRNDPIRKSNNIILSEPAYRQHEDVVYLSPDRQLVADALEVDEFVYDGCGRIIHLSEKADSRKLHMVRTDPIIIIGHGKKLRFVNVKIENGSLLRKYTFLGNDSSYSVSFEDGVDISLLEKSALTDDTESLDYKPETLGMSNAHLLSQNESSYVQSFTFEGQVISPEFTFYDSTKSFLDDSSGEKLLRAKLDLSFMYAAKDNDTWIRALVKDLMVEAGSGLVILDPTDISGGYTSVKEKTNISLLLTDICLHVSLSAISLILNLQSQIAVALQLGNIIPLAPCTNFDRLWVSPKENGPSNNLAFWRPQAPSNYVVLGDCVTSRPIPPSQAVMAVSNTYGRVKKPVSYILIGMFSHIQGFEVNEEHVHADNDCSIWMPVAPPGYTALGCVAHPGSKPPPNHIVYCLRSDLVTSTMYSECMYTTTSNPSFVAGFSLWRLDNVIGSFYAHASTESPPKHCGLDLSHILWSSLPHHVSSTDSALDPAADFDNESHEVSGQTASSSGWDVLRSISKPTNCYMSTPHFERIWWDKGNDVRRPVSIWRPIPRPIYAALGDCITEGLEPPALGIIFRADNPEIAAKPVQFTKVAQITVKGLDDIFFWYPIAPPGYVSLGCVVSRIDEPPSLESFCCPRMDLVSQANILEVPISRSSSSKASQCWSIWKVENQACTFLARSDLKKPSSRLAYAICDSVKPKTRENITAEMRLRRFSLTILDSFCGMMTPLFDMSITNIKLATHGRLEAMNAVLISSIAASTFNTQVEAWEPLVEPFDGIFKFETYSTNDLNPSRIGKRVRVAATSMLNINVTAANLERLVETIVSWRRMLEMEQKSAKLNEEAARHRKSGEELTFSALDEDDSQTVVVENKLGCDIYLKKEENNMSTVDLLCHEESASVWVPTPRFSDRLMVADEFRKARNYVAIQILEAKGLPILDDGNSHNFFCALRLVIDHQATDQLNLFPQSARTRCVKPLISSDEGVAKWNEIFIFEVPRKHIVVDFRDESQPSCCRAHTFAHLFMHDFDLHMELAKQQLYIYQFQGLAKLEVEVTNLAAKAGKGEVVGAFSFSVGHGVNILKKIASARLLHPPFDVSNVVTYPLKGRVQDKNIENIQERGVLLVSTSYFERKTGGKATEDAENDGGFDNDVGFWLGASPEGAWECIRSLLPLSVVPKSLGDDFLALEVVMKNGKKHAVLRSLVTVVNDSDVKLEFVLCSLSSIQGSSDDSSTSNCVVEEVFENQRYHPISGWGSSHNTDPGRWSTRDFSYTSKGFFEPPLPPGCKWLSTWTIDKFQRVDNDGWAYGPDFPSLKWPPTSKMKSPSDVVRRRRWIRTRQQFVPQALDHLNSDVTAVKPGSSSVVPWRSTVKDSNQCLQVRPCFEQPQSPYSWGRAVAIGSGYTNGTDQPTYDQEALSKQSTTKQGDKSQNFMLKLDQLEKKDILFCCPSTRSKQFWLSVSTDANILNTELNAPVYDWRIRVNSPLKLENRFPCSVEFTVWEKTKEGNFVERHQGVVSSRKNAHIYYADIQKPLYLSLFAQGGWVSEKDAIPILDVSSNNRISSFWMVHQQSKRRIRVSIEHDMGGNIAAQKTLRFFVPYWITNDTCLPLAYRIVEMEYMENTEADSLSLSRAVKSARTVLRSPSHSFDRRYSGLKKNVRVLEVIEDSSPMPSMLSPQDYGTRGGSPFPSQKDSYLPPRLGIAVAVRPSETYSPGISLLELENKERVEVKAYCSDGAYYKISAQLNMTSDRTKVVHFQPHTVFINRVGYSICVQQCDSQSQSVEWLHPTDPPKVFKWQSSAKVELIKLRVDGFKWSAPFSVSSEGVMRIFLLKESGNDPMQLRVEVRSGTKNSRYEVLFRPNSLSSPYRIENRSMFLPIRFHQVEGGSDSWQFLLPNSAASFLWEDLGRRRLLEILVDGANEMASEMYNIDEICDYQPTHVVDGPVRAIRVTVLKEEKVNIVRITDWMPENDSPTIMTRGISLPMPHVSSDEKGQQALSISEDEFHVIIEIADFGLSIVDHTPEEILYLSIQNLLLAYSTGLGSGISRCKLRMRGLQVDNQLPLTPMPVLFRPQRVVEETDYVLKLSITMQSNGSVDLFTYPFIGVQGPENSAFLINIHEPIIWRLHEMIQQVNLSRLYETQTTAVSVDPIIQIGVLNLSEVRFKVSLAMSPSQRPKGVLGFWSSLMTALGNTENMPVKINQRFHENVSMRQSSMISNAILNIRKDLLSQPLQLLSGMDILGNASSALGHMSKGVAALSMDKKFIQSRQRQESKGVDDISDVIREGGGALAKGLFRGFTGILTKPLEGAKSSGVEGFVQGVGKGLIGAAAQPVSGVLDLLSKTTEGANAMRMKIISAVTSEEQLLRRRLPRVISGDNLLRPYDEYKAEGQVILQLAECGSFFGQVDLFKVRGKFALSDAYEDHFLLPKGKILMVSHRRVILLQQPSTFIAQRKYNPARDPCSVLWDVLLDDLVTMELTHGKKDQPKAPFSRLVLYLKPRPPEFKEQVRVIKCSRDTNQAYEIYSSVERAMSTYGPSKSKEMLKNKVKKPYSPISDGNDSEINPKESNSMWSPQEVPVSVPLNSTFGSSVGSK